MCSDFIVKSTYCMTLASQGTSCSPNPHCGETGPGSEHEAYDVLLRRTKAYCCSLIIHPQPCRSQTCLGQASNHCAENVCFPRQSLGSLMPGYPRELMSKTQADVHLWDILCLCAKNWGCHLHTLLWTFTFFLPVFHPSPVECSFYFFCSGPSKDI